MYEKAHKKMFDNIVETNDFEEMKEAIKKGQMVKTTFCNESDCEDLIKEKTTGASTRCIPLGEDSVKEGSKCIYCEKEAKVNIYFARSY